MERSILLPSEQALALFEARFIRIVNDSWLESATGLLITIPARSEKKPEVAEVECGSVM